MVRRGDICWLELPAEGRRSTCVITRDEAIPALKNVVVATVSKTVRGIPSEIQLTAADGMPTECAISLDNCAPSPAHS
jgi:mRNA interferase MazF